ncbi:MAG: integrase core domain-containing protein [Rhodoferax sp.]
MQIWHTAAAVFVFFIFMLAALSYIGGSQNRQRRQGFACRPNQDVALPALSTTFSRKKPEWVMLEVLRIKALMGKNAGCRKVAGTFNRLHAPMSVGKSFVSDAIKKHQYLLLNISRELRDKRPRPTQINAVWGLDLTFVRESPGTQRTVFGAIDHGSRVCTRLVMVLNKRSWTLIGHLCLAIGEFGKPDAIRSDNEAVFNSTAFRTFLKLAGIRKQSIPICAPWCNGRIESYFGRIKPLLKQLDIYSTWGLQNALNEIRQFFNHIRTHQNLGGLTPAESWQGLVPTDIFQAPPKSVKLVQALDGLLVGYHIRR